MASFNKVILAGNLTRDPELRTFPSGTVVTKISLAVSRRFTDKNGEQRDETTFVDVDAFGKQAETISKYFAKGRPILVEGRLKLDQWDDKNTGEKRNKLGVILETFSFLDSKASSGGSSGGGDSSSSSYDDSAPPRRSAPAPRPAAAQQQAAPPAGDSVDEGDVPF
ncbi:MAG: single-stranded DNA-binding protein [Puniceicoccales bacterium]|jgi:single-strand DNA-binding protein|nr:single-stranded DNA-binding protein [Puniceicoccales bacterium]